MPSILLAVTNVHVTTQPSHKEREMISFITSFVPA